MVAARTTRGVARQMEALGPDEDSIEMAPPRISFLQGLAGLFGVDGPARKQAVAAGEDGGTGKRRTGDPRPAPGLFALPVPHSEPVRLIK